MQCVLESLTKLHAQGELHIIIYAVLKKLFSNDLATKICFTHIHDLLDESCQCHYSETALQYYLVMREIASHILHNDFSLIHYISGDNDSNSNP